MKKILVAFDGSETSEKAIKKIEELVLQNLNMEVCLLSVFNNLKPHTNAMMGRDIKDAEVRKIQKAHDEKDKAALMTLVNNKLEAIRQELEEKGLQIVTEGMVVDGNGNPGQYICDYAEKGQFDMIVVGSRGLGNIKRFILGSVSDYVLKHATVPVLIVK